MKKFIFPFCLTMVLCFSSCKKEVDQKKNLTEINSLTISKEIDKTVFTNEILPRVKELYEQDSVQYRIINNIAMKAVTEKNKEIYNIQVQNLKDELKYFN